MQGLGLQERKLVRLFVRRERYGRFYSCLVYLPRERYRREMRVAVQEILADALGAIDVVFETHFSESILARIYFVIITPPCSTPEYDIDDLEARIVAATTTWLDGLHDALFAQVDEALATRYLKDYAGAFPSGFQDDFHPRIAVNDIQRIERLRERGGLALHLYHPLADRDDTVHIRLYALGDSVPLSEVIPVLRARVREVLP